MGGNAVKKTESPLFVDFFTAFLPHVWDSVFFRAEIFGLLSPSLPLVCWSQGFGYGVLACNGIIIRTRPNILRTLFRKRAT